MGIFSDRCQALIDPGTKRVLTGEALEQARQDKKWPRCRNKVRKAAKFCNSCGSPAPGGWWRCPACGKWVGNDSKFCWNCDTPLYPADRADMAGGVWQKSPEVFAQRFEVGDIKRLLKKDLQVQAGTLALLLDGGRYKGILEPGCHDPESLARKINHLGDPPPRTVILVDNGDVVFPVRIEKLRSAEQVPLDFYGEIILHFDQKKAEPFLDNLLKAETRLGYAAISELLQGEIRHAVDALCQASTVDDMVRDPVRRLRLENSIQETLQGAMARYGLELVRVSSADFTGDEYDALVEKEGTAELTRRELEFDQRMRELLAKDRMAEFKTEKELEEYAAQLAQERGIATEHRDHELGLLKQVHGHELDAAEAAHQMDEETKRTEHELGKKVRWDEYEDNRYLAKVDVKIEAAKRALILRKQKEEQKLDLKRKKAALELEQLREKAKILDGQSVTTLIGLIDDEGKRKDLLEAQKRLELAGRPAEEILAMNAAASPEAAQALVELARVRADQLEKDFDERKTLSDGHAAQLERIVKAALEAAATAAKNPGAQTTINK